MTEPFRAKEFSSGICNSEEEGLQAKTRQGCRHYKPKMATAARRKENAGYFFK